MEELDYKKIKLDCYSKKINDITVIAEEKENELIFYSYCASPVIDNEYEIDSYLKGRFKGIGYSKIGYGGRKLEICFKNRSDELDTEHLRKCTEVVEDLRKHFDLLPCCMKCGGVSPVTINTEDGEVKILCDVCLGSEQLTKKHEKMIEERMKIAQKCGGQYIERLPMELAVKVAFQSGIIGAIGYMILISLAIITIPAIGLMPWIPSAGAGYYFMSRMIKLKIYNGNYIRIAVGTVIALITMMIFCFSGYLIIIFLIKGNFALENILDRNLIIIVALIIGGYLLAEIAANQLSDS